MLAVQEAFEAVKIPDSADLDLDFELKSGLKRTCFHEELITNKGLFIFVALLDHYLVTLLCQNKKINKYIKQIQIMMELSDNVTYMKLLHELKAEFPNMPDDLVRQSIQKVGQLFEIAKSVKNSL